MICYFGVLYIKEYFNGVFWPRKVIQAQGGVDVVAYYHKLYIQSRPYQKNRRVIAAGKAGAGI
jgi:hypothetical protein